MERLKEIGRYSKRIFNRSKLKEDTANLNFVTDLREEKFSIIWHIENIHRCALKCGEFLESPSFSVGSSTEIKWALRFYPKGRKTPESSRQRKKNSGCSSTVNDLQDMLTQYSGLFIKRITDDPVTSSFEYRFVCEIRLLLHSGLKKTIPYSYPEEGTADIIDDSAKSSEYGTDNFMLSKDLKIVQKLAVRCEIYVTNACNREAPDFNMQGFTKSDSLIQSLKMAYDNQKFSDITLQAGDVKFPAHKFILAARSQVFDAMFQHDMKENQTNIVNIENIEPAILCDMLQYMYTGRVDDFNVEKAMSLYPVADKYFLEELKKWSIDIMLVNLNVENVCQITVLADLHPDPKLKQATFNMFRNYTSDIFKRKEWQDLVRDTNRRALVSDVLQAVSADFITNCSDNK